MIYMYCTIMWTLYANVMPADAFPTACDDSHYNRIEIALTNIHIFCCVGNKDLQQRLQHQNRLA